MCIIGLHDRAALVENCQQIAQPAAVSALARDLGGVHGVDARLGEREREPGERVEVIVLSGRVSTRPVSYTLIS